MGSNYDYIILDVDGTLYRNSKYLMACRAGAKRINSYALARGVPKAVVARFVRKYVNRGKMTYPIREMSRRYGIDRKKFLDYAYDLDPGKFGITRDERIIRLLKKAKRRATLAVFTNSPAIWALRTLTSIGVRKLIPRRNIVTLESLDNGRVIKPSMASLVILLGILSAKPGRVAFLDDGKKNVENARKLGINSILICNGRQYSVGGHGSAQDIYSALQELADANR